MSTVQDPRKTWLATGSLLTVWSSLVVNGSVWANSLLAISVRYHSVGFFFLLLVMLPSEIAKLPTDLPVRGFPTVWKLLLLHYSLPRTGLHSELLCLSFCRLYFLLPPFKENGLPFWVPGVLCQRSEVVLWKLLSIQVIFWRTCWGESDLPILFFCFLGTLHPHLTDPMPFLNPSWTSASSQFTYCWSMTWRILRITFQVCEMSAIVHCFEHFFQGILGINSTSRKLK